MNHLSVRGLLKRVPTRAETSRKAFSAVFFSSYSEEMLSSLNIIDAIVARELTGYQSEPLLFT